MEDLASSTSFRGRASLLAWPALLLVAAKCGRGIAAHTSWQFLANGQLPVVVWTFLLLLVASVPYLLRQPWKSGRKRLRTKLWVRVTFNAGLYALETVLWHFCLSLYGPIRTLLMVDYAGVLLEPLFHLKQGGASGSRRIQGSLVAVAAYVLLFVLDSPGTGAPDEEWGLAGKLGGAVAVAAAVAIAFARKRYQAKLALQVGSDKRVTALSTVMGAAVLLPFALYAYLFSWEAAASSTAEASNMSLWLALGVGAAVFVVGNAWAEHAVRARFGSPAMPTKLGLAAGVVSATLAGWLWGPSAMSPVTLVAAALLAFGVHRRFQGEPEVGMQQQHAIFTAGGADEGLPTEAFSAGSSHGGDPVWAFFKNTLKEILANGESRSIFLFLLINLAFMGVEVAYGYWTNSLGLISDGFHMLFDCTALFIGLYASVISKWKSNKMFTYGYGRVEVVSGFVNGIFLVFIALFVLLESIERFVEPPKIETDRLLLVASLGLGVNLIGVFAFAHGHAHGGHGHSHGGDDDDHAKKKKKKKHDHGHSHSHSHGHGHDHGHSHGHGHGGHDDHHDDHDHEDHHDHDDHGHDHGHSHSHKKKKKKQQKKYAHSFTGSTSLLGKLAEPFADFFYRLWHEGLTDNLSGIWLHVMADTLGSVGVIFSSFCIMNFGWTIADPICSFFIALTILLSVIPLLKQCSVTLALRTPNSLQKDVDKAVLKTTRLEGVLGVRDVHVWKLAGDTVVATLHVHVQNHVEEQKIIKAVKGFFGDVADNLTIQVEKERFYELQTRLQKQPLSLPASGLPLVATPSAFSPQVGPSAGSAYLTSASRSVGPASMPPSGPSSFYDAGPSSILVSTSDDNHHHHHHHDDDDHHDHGHDHHHHHHYSDHHHPVHEQHIDISVDKNL